MSTPRPLPPSNHVGSLGKMPGWPGSDPYEALVDGPDALPTCGPAEFYGPKYTKELQHLSQARHRARGGGGRRGRGRGRARHGALLDGQLRGGDPVRIECAACRRRFGWRLPSLMPLRPAMRKPPPYYGTAYVPRRTKRMSDETYAAMWDAFRADRDERMAHLREMGRYDGALQALKRALWWQRHLLEQNQQWLMDHGLDTPILCLKCVTALSDFVTRCRPSMGIARGTGISVAQQAALLVQWMTRLLDAEVRRQRRVARHLADPRRIVI